MHSAWVVSFRKDITVAIEPGPVLVIQSPYGTLSLRQCPTALQPLLKILAAPGVPFHQLSQRAFATGVPNPLARLVHYLQLFARRGLLSLSATAKGDHLATLEPMTTEFKWPRVDTAGISSARFMLSRFAYLHRQYGRLLLESPLSSSRVVVDDVRTLAVLFALNRAVTAADIMQECPGLSQDACTQLLALLSVANVIGEADADGIATESGRPDLQTWEFHDLLFHSRSRIGRHDAPVGAVYPFLGLTDPPPAVKPPPSLLANGVTSISLTVPVDSTIRGHDLPFADVVEHRQSIREFGDEPISLEQLSEFLYRTARVRKRYDMQVGTPRGPLTMEFTSRPYPAGGALYELELYPLIQHCRGAHAGLYHYDAEAHQLVRVSEWTVHTQKIIDGAGLSSGSPAESIQVQLLVSARFSRVAWKYASMAYALILKHVGVLYQTMYLTATAMGLAPCGLGSGNPDDFANATGNSYYLESTVGEFLLGSRKPDAQDELPPATPAKTADS